MNTQKAWERTQKLYGLLSGREGKYTRNMNRFNNNGIRREDLWTPYVMPQAYVSPAQGAEGVQTQINVIKSAIQTISSKISQANIRPFFIPSDGTYDTTQACLKLQAYFDIWLDEQHAYPKSVMAFRDAAIFDVGVMHVDAENKSLARVPSWEYFIDPGEYLHGLVTEVMRYQKNFSLLSLYTKIDNPKVKKLISEDRYCQGQFVEYWDLYKGEKVEFFDGKQIREPIKLDYTQYGGLYRRPFVEIFYEKPIKGFFSTSLADDLYPIQRQIDELVKRLDAATRNAILQMILVPKGSGLKASVLENNVRAYDFTPGPDGGAPISISPPAINQQFVELLQMYIEQAYKLAGVSQLSAQSKAPSNLESGKALDTMEDIESDRFNIQLQQFTHLLVDCARVAIDCFPADAEILERPGKNHKVKWGDVRKQRDLFHIQFSAASSLSKDPNEKFAQIEMLANMGLIDKSQMRHFAQLPDLQGVYTAIDSSHNHGETVIERCIKTGDLTYLEIMDSADFEKMIVSRLNQMEAAGDKKEYIDNLTKLLVKVNTQNKAIAQKNAPPPPPEPIRDKSMDSGQIQNLSSILEKLHAGLISPQMAAPLLMAAYPNMPPALIQQMTQLPSDPNAPPPPPGGPGVPGIPSPVGLPPNQQLKGVA